MVNSITAGSIAKTSLNPVKTSDVKTLLRYVNNQALKEIPDTFTSTTKSAASSAALFEGIPLLNFLKRGKKVTSIIDASGKAGTIKNALKNIDAKTLDALKNIKTGKGSIFKRIGNFFTTTKQAGNEYQAIKTAVKTAAKSGESTAKIVAETAKATNKSGLLKFGIKEGSKLGKASKILKSSGAGFMMAVSGISEMCTEVVPTFKELGKEKGLKQLGKSTVKVIGDAIGFFGGQQAGVAIGSAIGSAIFPGVGTAIGAVCGFVGGMLGSFAAGKVTKAITGKTEREIANNKQQNQQAKDIANSSKKVKDLKAEAMAKIQEEAETTGQLSEDSQTVLQLLDKMETSKTTNPFTI